MVTLPAASDEGNLSPVGARRHIRAAIEAGASREEILFVLKVAAVMSIHSCMFGVPILLEEASAGSLEDAGETTLNVYTHAIPDSQKIAVERVAGVLFSDVLNSAPDEIPGGPVN